MRTVILAVAMGLSSTAFAGAPPAPAAAAAPRKYEVKSGVLEMSNSMMPDAKHTLYFDDYGAREATHMVSEITFGGQTTRIESWTITTEGWQIQYNPVQKTATKRRLSAVDARMTPDQLAKMSDGMRGKYRVQGLEARTVAGKECKGIAAEMMGTKVKSWTWKNLPMYSETDMGGKTPIVLETKSIQTDVPVKAEIFQVPAGVKITEEDAAGMPVAPAAAPPAKTR